MPVTVKDRKTGTDIVMVVTMNATPAEVAALPQIIMVYYYKRDGVTTLISFFALVPTDAAIVAEAAAEGKTVHPLTIDDSNLDMVIPRDDTEGLDLTDSEIVVVFGELSYFDNLNKKFKNADRVAGDPVAFNMIQSPVKDLI